MLLSLFTTAVKFLSSLLFDLQNFSYFFLRIFHKFVYHTRIVFGQYVNKEISISGLLLRLKTHRVGKLQFTLYRFIVVEKSVLNEK